MLPFLTSVSRPHYLHIGLLLTACLAPHHAVAQATEPRAELPTFRIGDHWRWERRSGYTGLHEGEIARTVTAITDSEVRGTENGGEFVMTPDLSVTQTPMFTVLAGKSIMMSFPLEVGKEWGTDNTFGTANGFKNGRNDYKVRVVAFEKIRVPAGEFAAFKIESNGRWYNYRTNTTGVGRAVWWYAPAVRNIVKWDYRDQYTNSVQELVEVRVQQ